MKKFLLIVFLTPVVLLLGCASLLAFALFTHLESYSWRQKLTITVETQAGEVSASSVSQVSWAKHWIQTDGMGWDYDLTGEAVVVEVTPGRYLFALLGSPGRSEYMGTVAAASINGRDLQWIDGALFDEVQGKRDRAAGEIAVPYYQYPMLATFGDITDPASVKLVDPDDLDATFGCTRDAAPSNFPWRVAGVTYRDWLGREVVRQSRELASERSGLPGPVGDAITELYFITDDHNYDAADKLRIAELQAKFTDAQQQTWREARYALEEELPKVLPNPQSVSAKTGGQCHQITSVMLEITREAVTVGVVEQVLPPAFFQRWAGDLHAAFDQGRGAEYANSLQGKYTLGDFVRGEGL